jgi:hypothetical protein
MASLSTLLKPPPLVFGSIPPSLFGPTGEEAEFCSSVAQFREWDQARWQRFFVLYDMYMDSFDPSQNHVRAVIRSGEFQDTMIKVGVFGDAHLFDQTPCVWDHEVGVDPVRWSKRIQNGVLRITSLATKILKMPDEIWEEEQVQWNCVRKKGDMRFEDGIVVEAHDRDPIIFERNEREWGSGPVHGWSVNLPERSRGFELMGYERGCGVAFSIASFLFGRERDVRANIHDCLTPLLPRPVADLIYGYATYHGRDNRAQEKRDMRNLFYRTFEKAAVNQVPGGGRPLDILQSVLGHLPTERLKMTSGVLAQFVGDNEETVS